MNRLTLLALVIAVAFGIVGSDRAAAAVCAEFPNQAAAQVAANTRDGDGDGIYCEALPCPCLRPSATPGGAPPTAPAGPSPTPSPTAPTFWGPSDALPPVGGGAPAPAMPPRAARCSDFRNQAAAQSAANTRDGDGDGFYCESLPCPCAAGLPGKPTGSKTTPATGGSAPGSTQPSGGATPSTGGGSAGGAAGSARPPKTFRRLAVTVTSVVDGDTVKVLLPNGARTTVRVIGIDTPETKKPRVPVECGGREATALMTSLASGKAASLISDPSQDSVDRYGRLLGYVEVDGRDLGLHLVRAGRADVYIYGGVPFARTAKYQAAQNRARAEVLGVFATCKGDFHSEQSR